MPCGWADSGEISLLANPLKLSATPPSYRLPPPRLDEHREEVLRDWLSADLRNPPQESSSCTN